MMSIYAMLDANDNFGTTIVRQAPTLVFRDLCSFCDNPRATYNEKDKCGYTVVYSSYNRTYIKIDDNGEIVATGLIVKCPSCGKKLIDDKEQWKNIEGHPCYEISSKGRICSFAKARGGIISKGGQHTDGYMSQTFTDNMVNKAEYVHRLVATAFIPNPYQLPVINHKDHNRSNNRVDNLEWCTSGYNNKFVKHPRYQMKKDVIICWDKNGNCVAKYESAHIAAKKAGVSDMAMTLALKGELKTAGGFEWQLVKRKTQEEKKHDYKRDMLRKENSNSSVA